MTQLEIGGRFIRSGFWMLLFGMVMSFGMVLHYVANISPPIGPEFTKTIYLWYACPWTLSTAVVLGGALGMIAIGAVYATLARMASAIPIVGPEKSAVSICTISLIAMFLTGYAGYFVVNSIWPDFYYSVVTDGKNLWLLLQLACMVAYTIGVFLAFNGIRRISYSTA
ncbi:hypothetical protein CN186_29465 [Sinorhizobium medicae]|uniref:hypothetical protein n=1 Tax=Sinorhizobium medicae TaxID=110321 RepID=UPI000FDC0E3E|nr:hypothetical protein [Sinorhizobium medicae]RVI87937.1 hypothetical protein CN186_29465 [Sinorhizobium medicae]